VGLQSIVDVWLPLGPFPGRLPGKQARDFDQCGGGRAVHICLIWTNRNHLAMEMAKKASPLDMAKSNLFLAAMRSSL
jgi:hypothetical protein